jgi:hypothetical protein
MPFKGEPFTISEERKKINDEVAKKGLGGSYIGKDGKLRKATMKQRKFVKRTIETLNPTQAAMEVYNVKDRTVARTMATQNLNKKSIQILLDKYIPDTMVLETVKEQLFANTIKGKDDTEVPDNMARLKAADIALKLKGAYPTDAVKLQLSGQNQINFIVSKMDPSEEVKVVEAEEVEEKNDTTEK